MIKLKRNAAKKPQGLTNNDALYKYEKIALRRYFNLSSIERRHIRPPYNEDVASSNSVVLELDKIQSRKCAYCETPLDGDLRQYISHYRPLSNAILNNKSFEGVEYYSWFAYEWQNIMLVCSECTNSKLNNFPIKGAIAERLCTWKDAQQRERPLLLSPFLDNPSAHIEFDFEGEAVEITSRGTITIEVLSLNRGSLKDSRRLAIRSAFEVIRQATHAGADKKIASVLHYSMPFSGAIHAALNNVCRIMEQDIRHKPVRGEPLIARIHRLKSIATDSDWEYAAHRARRNNLNFLIKKNELDLTADFRKKNNYSYVSGVRIKNFKGLETFSIDLKRGSYSKGKSAPCLVLLGENAVGKSSILQAIALALMPGKDRARLRLNLKDIVPHEGELGFKGVEVDRNQVEVTVEFEGGDKVALFSGYDSNKIRIDGESRNFVFGYGARRYFVAGKSALHPGCPNKTLFNSSSSLPDPTLWLLDVSDKLFEAVSRALAPMLSLGPGEYVTRRMGGVFVFARGNLTPIGSLSDGYKSLFSTAVDIMRNLLDHWGDLEYAQGVVLIDEIENHLHPRWKMRVISALREALPRVQFIISTHDPLCLRGMKDGEVQVIYRDHDGQVRKVDDLPQISKMRVDQILTSDYFGLASTEDPQRQQAIDELAHYGSLKESELSDEQRKARDLALQRYGDLPVVGDSLDRQILADALTRHIRKFSSTPLERRRLREESVAMIMDVLERAMPDDPGR